MNIEGDLKLVYDSMDADRIKEVSSFLERLPLTVTDKGFPGSDELRVGIYGLNNSLFCLTPVERRVEYDLGKGASKKYVMSFGRSGHEGEELVDELFVGFGIDPYTGIFLRTGPVIARV